MIRTLLRHWLLTPLLFCAVLVSFASNAAPSGEASHQNMKFCNMYMGCNCECKVGTDSRKWHEGNESHYDVLCPHCNKFAKEKQKKNIRSGYFCPEANDWVD